MGCVVVGLIVFAAIVACLVALGYWMSRGVGPHEDHWYE